jgi:lysozyme family protein
MGERMFDRRRVLALGGAAFGASAVRAQTNDPLRALETLSLPRELQAILPAKELDIVRLVGAILRAERDAETRRLPPSPLAFKAGLPIGMSDNNLYSATIPRLVSLIDRAESTDVELGDRAGELLAEINATQREIPEGLTGPPETSRARDFASLKSEYASMFATLAVRPEYADNVEWQTRAMRQFRPRYEQVGKTLDVPWFMIGAIHGLEASFNFRAHLHNGDYPLTQRTRQVPANRPPVWLPPSDWGASAKDALTLLGFTGQRDWSVERTLYRLEAYNGFGYRRRAAPTPYLWAFSTHYDRGKFVKDGKWSDTARSQQCGAAVVLRQLRDAGDIVFVA